MPPRKFQLGILCKDKNLDTALAPCPPRQNFNLGILREDDTALYFISSQSAKDIRNKPQSSEYVSERKLQQIISYGKSHHRANHTGGKGREKKKSKQTRITTRNQYAKSYQLKAPPSRPFAPAFASPVDHNALATATAAASYVN